MSTLTHAAMCTVRITAATAAAPLIVGAAASAATAKLVGWELRQVASSPLSAKAKRLWERRQPADSPLPAEAWQLKTENHAPAAAGRANANALGRQHEHAGNGRDSHRRTSALVAVR